MGYELVVMSPLDEILSEDERQSLLETLWRDTTIDGRCELTNLGGDDIDEGGQRLFLLKLLGDESEVCEAYRLIICFAKQHRLRVDNPQSGEEINLECPGEYPPLWKPKIKSRFAILNWLVGRKYH
jgi:hypothetical protein